MNRILSLLLLVLLAAPAFAEDDLVSRANVAYQDGRFEEAAKLYLRARSDGSLGPHGEYNYGNALYRLGRFGEAIAAYRTALRELPGDPDVKANLLLARKHASDKLDEPPDIASRVLAVIVPPVDSFTSEVLFLAVYSAGWILLIVSALFWKPLARIWGWSLLVVSMPLGVLAFGVAQGRDGSPRLALTATARSLHPAVIVSKEAAVHSGDGESYQVILRVHEGAEIMSGEQRNDWLEVFIPGARKGWIKADSATLVR